MWERRGLRRGSLRSSRSKDMVNAWHTSRNDPFVPCGGSVVTRGLPPGARPDREAGAQLVDQAAPLGMRDRLEAAMGAELAVDVVEVVAKRMSGNV